MLDVLQKLKIVRLLIKLNKKRKETTRRGFKTRKEAVLCEANIKTEIAKNGLLNTEVTTLKEIYELWYEGYQHTIKKVL